MKVQVIRSYDLGDYSKKIEETYRDKIVDHVDTHTEVMRMRNEDVLYYIAIVFYTDKEEQ